MRLTDISIRTLAPPQSGEKIYYDDTLTGFGVRVRRTGSPRTVPLLRIFTRSAVLSENRRSASSRTSVPPKLSSVRKIGETVEAPEAKKPLYATEPSAMRARVFLEPFALEPQIWEFIEGVMDPGEKDVVGGKPRSSSSTLRGCPSPCGQPWSLWQKQRNRTGAGTIVPAFFHYCERSVWKAIAKYGRCGCGSVLQVPRSPESATMHP